MHVCTTSVDLPSMDSVLVVQVYFDVFPTDLPSLSLELDIDFGINIELGT